MSVSPHGLTNVFLFFKNINTSVTNYMNALNPLKRHLSLDSSRCMHLDKNEERILSKMLKTLVDSKDKS